ncbi:MAG: hypothetical protein NZ518_11775, partial [Dehalococcoidia bacterium]|nr:hypothetical protein [Dehalococcoidia bacterium]
GPSSPVAAQVPWPTSVPFPAPPPIPGADPAANGGPASCGDFTQPGVYLFTNANYQGACARFQMSHPNKNAQPGPGQNPWHSGQNVGSVIIAGNYAVSFYDFEFYNRNVAPGQPAFVVTLAPASVLTGTQAVGVPNTSALPFLPIPAAVSGGPQFFDMANRWNSLAMTTTITARPVFSLQSATGAAETRITAFAAQPLAPQPGIGFAAVRPSFEGHAVGAPLAIARRSPVQ